MFELKRLFVWVLPVAIILMAADIAADHYSLEGATNVLDFAA